MLGEGCSAEVVSGENGPGVVDCPTCEFFWRTASGCPRGTKTRVWWGTIGVAASARAALETLEAAAAAAAATVSANALRASRDFLDLKCQKAASTRNVRRAYLRPLCPRRWSFWTISC